MQVVLRCAKDVEGKPTTYGLTLERRVESGTNVTSVLIKGLDVGSTNEGVLQRGDELIAIGGVRVQGNYNAVIEQLTKYKPADGVDAEIVRKPYVPIAAPLAASAEPSSAAAPRAAADAAAAPPTTAASTVLPDGWREAKTETGRTYYYNTETRERSWDRPAPATIDPAARAAVTGKPVPPDSPVSQRPRATPLPSAVSEAATPTAAPAGVSLESALAGFYLSVNQPEKAASCGTTATKYIGHEAKLWDSIRAKYGADAVAPHQAAWEAGRSSPVGTTPAAPAPVPAPVPAPAPAPGTAPTPGSVAL